MIRPPGQPLDFDLDTFSDDAETTHADPTTLTLTFTKPDGTAQAPHTWPGGDITRLALGQFRYTGPFDPGHWDGLWIAAGAVSTSLYVAFDIADQAPYANPADVRTALAGTGTLSGTAAALSDDDLFAALYEAQAEVNGRLEGRGYTVPFRDTPALVVQVTRDYAAYIATLTYRRGDPILPGDPVLLRYQRAQSLLKDISSGLVPLAVPAGAGTDVGDSGNVAVSNPVDGDLWNAANFDLSTVSSPWSARRWW